MVSKEVFKIIYERLLHTAMLIRSQDKSMIVECKDIQIVSASRVRYIEGRCEPAPDCSIFSCGYKVGEYSSREKALKVMDMICDKYNKPIYINVLGDYEYVKYERCIFQMPQEDEVELYDER